MSFENKLVLTNTQVYLKFVRPNDDEYQHPNWVVLDD